MKCPECGKKMIRRRSQFNSGYWWGCSGYPACTISSAENPDGSMMSTPADYKLKSLRVSAHKLCEGIWGEWNSPDCDKDSMYDWLKSHTRTGHIGTLNYEETEDLIALLLKFK